MVCRDLRGGGDAPVQFGLAVNRVKEIIGVADGLGGADRVGQWAGWRALPPPVALIVGAALVL